MSWSLTKIVGLVIIPLMIATTILSGLSSIQSGPFSQNQDRVETVLDREARHMTLGINNQDEEVDQEVANEQFRGLVIYSQISATNCRLLYHFHIQGDNGNKASKYEFDNNRPNKISSDNSDRYLFKYVIPGRPNSQDSSLFNYLERSSYVPTCVGTANKINPEIMDNTNREVSREANEGNLFQAAVDGVVGKFVGGVKDAWNAASCKLEPQWASERGNDMEGKFGKITFEAESTIKAGKAGDSRVWSVQTIADTGSCWANNENFYGPSFWAGGEWMNYLPYPKHDNPLELNYYINNAGPPFNEHKSASMDAIVDAPAITTEDLSSHDGGSGNFPRSKVFYVICSGAQGHVQTNANDATNTGEAIWGKKNSGAGEYKGKETITYTFIRVTENRESCLNNIEYGGLDRQGTIDGTSCETFEDATASPQKRENGLECGLIPYTWEHEGDEIKEVYQIGWS